MPKHVRNFWIETRIDGRQTKDASGPAAKDGGFETTIKIRNKGSVEVALKVVGRVNGAGNLLELDVYDGAGYSILSSAEQSRLMTER